eukprot:Mycagemm_TRINITY_DN9948_c0_g4::TRINITY_DN9948_c0_g4_i1::g.3401::m.3401 type:complete len:106 gc:universal TRINITY_DN9948_c0_g4_i1:141-458(+)
MSVRPLASPAARRPRPGSRHRLPPRRALRRGHSLLMAPHPSIYVMMSRHCLTPRTALFSRFRIPLSRLGSSSRKRWPCVCTRNSCGRSRTNSLRPLSGPWSRSST